MHATARLVAPQWHHNETWIAAEPFGLAIASPIEAAAEVVVVVVAVMAVEAAAVAVAAAIEVVGNFRKAAHDKWSAEEEAEGTIGSSA